MQEPGQMKPPVQPPGAPPEPGRGGRGGGFGGMQRPPIPPELDADKVFPLSEARLVQILKDPKSTPFQISVACKKLAQVGSREAVPALAALLANEQFSHYARFALEPMPDASADEALRGALVKTKGKTLVGVINSIGERKDAKAVDQLAKLMSGADAAVAKAAAAALGRIGSTAAAKPLQDALARAKGELRPAVADACLNCAEGLLAAGERARAMALYDILSRPDTPKAVRLAAMHSVIAAEISLRRTRSAPPAKK